MKLRTKTYLTFLSLGTFLTIMGVVVYYLFFVNNYEKVVIENIQILFDEKEKSIKNLVEQKASKANTASSFSGFKFQDGKINRDIVLQEFNNLKNTDVNIEDLFLIDEKNKIFISSNLEMAGEFLEFGRDRPFYLDGPIVDSVQVGENDYYFFVSVPIIESDSDTHKHLFVVKYNINLLEDILNDREGLKSTGESLLAIANDGNILFLNEKRFPIELDQANIGLAKPMRSALDGNESLFLDTLDYRNADVIAISSYIDMIDTGLVVKIDREEALSFVDQMIFVSFVLGLSIILLVYVATNALSRRLSIPIEKLNEAVQIITQGNFTQEVIIDGDDEIMETAKAFNMMAKKIREAKEKTDKQIEEQTKNLRDQQMAILNILEDVEAEKEKVADTAKELEKFKQAVENTSDHVVITDENGVIIYANKAVETITGFSRDEVIGTKVGTKKNWGGIMGQDFYNNLWTTIKKDKKSFSGYINNVRKNGEEYEALANISPVFDAGGNVIFFVGIERDFTREREIDRAKSEFVSLASHQLRTPLSTVNWYAEILLSEDAGKINKDQREYLTEVYKGNQRMVNLVNALLNVSRIDLGTLSIDPEPTNLIDLAESVLKELELKIKERKHKIIRNFDKNIPKIDLDPKMMRIVWQNYLTNAVKYTPKNGAIEVNIKKKKTLVEISVKDDGMGIPEAQQEKIFKKLFRADNARETETDGTGLGLYIVKSIVEEFGGKVWFKSKENAGSTFFATIPLKGVKAKAGSKGLEYVD